MENQIKDDLPDVCYKIADWWDGRKLQRRIVCAANRFQLKDGGELVIPGVRHYSKDMALVLDQLRDKVVSDHVTGDNQGFVDQWGDYHTREVAVIIAEHAGQHPLYKKNTTRSARSPVRRTNSLARIFTDGNCNH
ncbi:hypothetical protein P1A145kb_p233 [Pectobacterium phage DU_PP_I]|nr:hypothetical protein P1A145kb_p233 [Pectobacterium phage DU_PP_I]ATS93950.1 hypothetical protein P12B145kb_p234 [Pectobacterium phage DU_PP_IV]